MKYFEGLKTLNSLFLCVEHTKEKNNVMACTLDKHIHPGVELIYVTSGIFDMHINGRTERINEGEAALMFPFQPHGYERYEGSEYIRFDFDKALASDFFRSKTNLIGKSSVFKPSEITKLIIKKNISGKSEYSLLNIKALLYSTLFDFTSQIELVAIEKDNDVLVKTISYINNHMETPLQMNTVAKMLGYSESYFSRAINKTAGMGFNTLLAAIRVENAKRLLRESEKTIFDIIIECGFGSERSFYRQFTSIVGETPLKYRNSIIFDT